MKTCTKRKLILKQLIDRANRICILSLSLVILYWIIQITTLCSFHTPSSSMIPTLIPNESGIVNKWKMGGRIFNVYEAINGIPFKIRRLPGYGKLDRNDVIIFNFPFSESDYKFENITMNLNTYYCKRAIAIGGDTLEVKDCFYRVRGCSDTLGIASEQMKLRDFVKQFSIEHKDKGKWPGWMRCCPRDSLFGWTISDMGPFVIPKEGLSVKLDRKNWILYRKYIEWETGNKLLWEDSIASINGIFIESYIFSENYCFAAGDNVMNSMDSRYFGLVPEKFIVGTTGILWKSPNPKRIFKRLNIH